MLLGDERGVPVRAPFSEFYAHTLLCGKSGRGKSYQLFNIVKQIMRAGYPCAVVDGKGDLTAWILALCLTERKSVNSVIFVNPHDRRYSVGFNWLAPTGDTTPENHAKSVLECLKKLNRESETRVLLEEWAPAALGPLVAAHDCLTLAEFHAMARLGDEGSEFRGRVLQETRGLLTGNFAHRQWADLRTYAPSDQANITRVLRTRASVIWNSAALLPIFGQVKTTIDFGLLDMPGSVILVHAGVSANLSEQQGMLLGSALVQRVVAHGWTRQRVPEDRRERAFLVIDEVHRFADRELATAYSVMRGLGISVIAACQTLEQLADTDPYVAEAIIGNSNVIGAFSTGRGDAERLAKELWSGHLSFKRVKDTIYQTKHRPVESTRTIIGRSTSRSESESTGFAESVGTSLSESMNADSLQNLTLESTSEGESRSTSSSSHIGLSTSESESEVTVPFYEMEEFKEKTGTTYYTPEESWEEATGDLKRQGVRHMCVAWADERPHSIITPGIRLPRVTRTALARYEIALAKRWGRPTDTILREVENRVANFLAGRIRVPLALGGPTQSFNAHNAVRSTEVMDETHGEDFNPDNFAAPLDLGEEHGGA